MSDTPTPTPVPRCDFVLLFDVIDGNPNGDPDAGNAPRIDPETNQGLVSDVCLKRKIRNFVELTRADAPGHHIYIREGAILNDQHQRAYDALVEDGTLKQKGKSKDKDKATYETTEKDGNTIPRDLARDWMCQNFFDVRTFGAVMSTGVNAGQVRGPLQLSFARSIDPILPMEHSITRRSVTTQKEWEKQQTSQEGQARTMGRKETVPYGLYRCHGTVNPYLAAQTGFSADDLSLVWDAIARLFENDQSAARARMATRALFVFEHEQPLGNAPGFRLQESITVTQNDDSSSVPRTYEDYTVSAPTPDELPDGVTLRVLDGYTLRNTQDQAVAV